MKGKTSGLATDCRCTRSRLPRSPPCKCNSHLEDRGTQGPTPVREGPGLLQLTLGGWLARLRIDQQCGPWNLKHSLGHYLSSDSRRHPTFHSCCFFVHSLLFQQRQSHSSGRRRLWGRLPSHSPANLLNRGGTWPVGTQTRPWISYNFIFGVGSFSSCLILTSDRKLHESGLWLILPTVPLCLEHSSCSLNFSWLIH